MEFVKLEVNNFVGTVTLNRAPANAFNIQMYKELMETMQKINTMDDIRVVVIKSEGRIFVAGNDVKEFLSITDSEAYAKTLSDCMVSVYNCRVPVVAAVDGAAFGAGMALAACCDIIVASQNATFGIPEIKVGIIGAAGFLELMVPEKVVRYKSLVGGSLSAEEMKNYGGVQKVVPIDELDNAVNEIVEELLQQGPIALRYFKKAMNINANAQLVEKYKVEADFTGEYINTHDSKEAVMAFLEKETQYLKGNKV